MTERICKTCGKSFVLGTRDMCSTCRELGLRPVKAEPTKYGPTKTQDSKIDLGYAIQELDRASEELVRARDELTRIPAGVGRHRREKVLAEPLSRVLLAKRFVDSVLKRHGVKVSRVNDDEDIEP